MSSESEEQLSTEENADNSGDILGSDDSVGEVEYMFLTQVIIPNFWTRERIPRNTSRLPGNDWMGEIMCAHSGRFYDNIRMHKPCFLNLVELLTTRGLLPQSQQSRVSQIEEVALFMHIVSMHIQQRDSMERFQHSLETINRHILRVMKALNHLTPELITPPNFNEVPPQVLHNPHFY